MTAADLNTLINFKCGTNDTTFPLEEKLALVNIFIKEIASKIEEKNAGYFLIPSTFDLVADQREYAIGDDLLNSIQKVEFKFTATATRYQATALKDYKGSEDESVIANDYGNGEGETYYVIRRRALFVLSGTIIDVTDGGRIWAHIFPAKLTDLTGDIDDLAKDPSTTSFGFPTQFHELLARRVSIEYKGVNKIALNAMDGNYPNDLRDVLDAISQMDNSLEIIGNLPAANSKELHNNGWNL